MKFVHLEVYWDWYKSFPTTDTLNGILKRYTLKCRAIFAEVPTAPILPQSNIYPDTRKNALFLYIFRNARGRYWTKY